MLPHLDEVSIGHALISHALFVGLDRAVRDYLAALSGAELWLPAGTAGDPSSAVRRVRSRSSWPAQLGGACVVALLLVTAARAADAARHASGPTMA